MTSHLALTERESIPDAALWRAGRSILWWLATALEGALSPEQEDLQRYFAVLGGRAESSVLGSPMRAPAEVAGLINARAGKLNEHEEKYWVSENIGFSIGCCVVPAALAIAQAIGNVSGSDLLAAVALATDFEARLLAPVGMDFIPGRKAANTSFALGNYGAAAVASRLLGLTPEQTSDALGLAHAQSCGTYQGQYDGRGVAVQCGFAVRNGITAARLANAGITGPIAFLTGRASLYAHHFPDTSVDVESVLEELGQEYLGAKIGYKAYPCGIVAHPAIDAIREIRAQIGDRQIESIEIVGPESLLIMVEPASVKRSPTTATEARFSLQWVSACAVRDGNLTLDHFDDPILADAKLHAIAEKVHVTMSVDAVGTSMEIRFADGSRLSSSPVVLARGHPDRPLETSEMKALFRSSAKRAHVAPSSVDRALDMVVTLASVDDVGEISSLLHGDGPVNGITGESASV